jgi:hypothetical protein
MYRDSVLSIIFSVQDPVSDSWTEDMMASMILLLTRIGALCGGG